MRLFDGIFGCLVWAFGIVVGGWLVLLALGLIAMAVDGIYQRQVKRAERREAVLRELQPKKDAVAVLETELNFWLRNYSSQARTADDAKKAPPISFKIKGMTPDRLNAIAPTKGISEKEWKDWPAYRIYVDLTFEGDNRAVVIQEAAYNVSWSGRKKRWYVRRI